MEGRSGLAVFGWFAGGVIGGWPGLTAVGWFAVGVMEGRSGLAAFGWFTGGVMAGWPGLAATGWFPVWFPGRPMFGVAGLPGGACLTIGCVAVTLAGRKLCTSCRAKGCPGCAARTCCCFAKATGGGGGVALAITCRLATAAGGAATRFAVAALAPSTLSRVGATATLELIGAEAIACALTTAAALPTGCALTKARCGTAVTAPFTSRFA